MVRVNEISEELEFCSACKTGYLRPTGEVVAKGESAGGFADIGTEEYSNVIIVNNGTPPSDVLAKETVPFELNAVGFKNSHTQTNV